ncbi:outer membrane beta-barrel protein [Flavobacterium branchiicola]|uniref:Outer membrane beta-barrel protein n=1 Tax=Flavobacterium branchiicola TaxID=1114875 RepID=A0ABV9PI83_9FLAO|nr:outer membrane beta-barrel protein [Flavobacterium branchiicola]MBS7256187.1 porin family protein [Flavobacterium branchiicola]
MKTKLITLIALFTICFASAQQQEIETELHSAKGVQFEKGDMFVEGALSVSTASDQNHFGFTPKFGYFLTDKLAVGADLGYSHTKIKSTDQKESVFGIGVLARYYFLQLDSKRFKAYSEAGLGYGRNTTKSAVIDDTNNSVKANISVGLNYFITKNIAATFVLADVLSYNNVSAGDQPSTDTFNLNLNVFQNIFSQPTFGLLYKF